VRTGIGNGMQFAQTFGPRLLLVEQKQEDQCRAPLLALVM
jgi:hypothetical protein